MAKNTNKKQQQEGISIAQRPDVDQLPQAANALTPAAGSWISSLAKVLKQTQPCAESRMRTMISCDVRSGKPSIYVPPDMAELQPRSLSYLHAFARTHELQLVEDRRRVSVQPLHDKRNQNSPAIVKGVGELLQQLGMPGPVRVQSSPHRLAADSPHIGMDKLIQMAAVACPSAKRTAIEPNRTLGDVLDDNYQPINAFGCKLITADTSTVLSHFDSDHFRAVGYSAGKQYVMHLFLAGGLMSTPKLWADFHTLTRTDFQFHLFNAANAKDDVGLFYATFYFDVAETPAPWWLNTWADSRLTSGIESEPPLLRRAG